jgi:hypothetical protein
LPRRSCCLARPTTGRALTVELVRPTRGTEVANE